MCNLRAIDPESRCPRRRSAARSARTCVAMLPLFAETSGEASRPSWSPARCGSLPSASGSSQASSSSAPSKLSKPRERGDGSAVRGCGAGATPLAWLDVLRPRTRGPNGCKFTSACSGNDRGFALSTSDREGGTTARVRVTSDNRSDFMAGACRTAIVAHGQSLATRGLKLRLVVNGPAECAPALELGPRAPEAPSRAHA